jgi:NAD-dependent DNA ligase
MPLVGHAATISPGEWITATGNRVNDRTHGQQFKARFLKTSAPTSVEGIEKYLASGMIRGVGPVYAKKLLRAFGEKVFDVIEAEPGRLQEVDGIGPVRAGRITVAWAEQKAVREIMVFLHSHGVGTGGHLVCGGGAGNAENGTGGSGGNYGRRRTNGPGSQGIIIVVTYAPLAAPDAPTNLTVTVTRGRSRRQPPVRAGPAVVASSSRNGRNASISAFG